MTNPPGDDEPSKIDELAPAEEPEPKDRKRRRSRWLVIGVPVAVVVVAAAIVGGVLLVNNNSSSSSTSPSAALDYGRVQQTTVAQTQTLSGTIAYTATQTVTNRLSTTSSSSTSSTSSSGSQGTSTSGSGSSTSSSSSTAPGSGTLTTMAAVGSVIKVGGTFFTVDEQPVVAMYGTLPAYRDMQDGDTGTDITQLQQSLVDLGYNPGGVDGTFGAATVAAVEAWQTAESLTVDGIVHLGQVAFVAGPSRVIAQVATIGDTAPSGTQILSIGPESPVVTTSESSTQLGLLSQGQKVDVQLPDNSIVIGKVTSVGAASSSSSSSSASGASSGGSSSSSGSTSLTIALDNPALGNNIAGSSVNVIVTTASVRDVLAVPLGALLATSSGDFIVQVAGANGSLDNVSVNPTVYDDTSGIVAVPGAHLTPGQRVVVASS
jgi:hypothetical protein